MFWQTIVKYLILHLYPTFRQLANVKQVDQLLQSITKSPATRQSRTPSASSTLVLNDEHLEHLNCKFDNKLLVT